MILDPNNTYPDPEHYYADEDRANCKQCKEDFNPSESTAEENQEFCTVMCEGDANELDQVDLGDSQQYVDNQGK